jgi:hypothetical protein
MLSFVILKRGLRIDNLQKLLIPFGCHRNRKHAWDANAFLFSDTTFSVELDLKAAANPSEFVQLDIVLCESGESSCWCASL